LGLFGVEICQALADLVTLFIAIPISVSSLRYFNDLRKQMAEQPDSTQQINSLQQLDSDFEL
jgi:hypothetical protein